MSAYLRNEVPKIIYEKLDDLGSDKVKKYRFDDLKFILETTLENKLNIKLYDHDWIYPIISTILNSEKERLGVSPVPVYKRKKSQEQKRIMGVPPVRMYKGGHIVGKLKAKRTDLPKNMLGTLVKHGLEQYACSEDLSISEIKDKFNKIVTNKYVPKEVLLSGKLRKSHNDAKYNLIKSVVKPNSYVLDVGSGRGGDLSKWKAVSAKLTMIDPDGSAVAEAKKRAKTVYPNAIIRQGDILSMSTKDKFDYICYNFSLQYIFKDTELASRSLERISRLLVTNGKFFGIIPDADKIKKYTANWSDQLGNTMSRNGSTVSFYLANTPFYENGPIEEPLIGMSSLKKLCFEYNLRLVWYKDLFPNKTGLISDIYTMFLFEKIPGKMHNKVYDTKTILGTDLEEMIKDIIKDSKITHIEDLVAIAETMLFDEIRQNTDYGVASRELERLKPYIHIYANRALLSVSPTRRKSPQRRTSPSPFRLSGSPPKRRRSPSPFRLSGSPPQRRRARSPTRK